MLTKFAGTGARLRRKTRRNRAKLPPYTADRRKAEKTKRSCQLLSQYLPVILACDLNESHHGYNNLEGTRNSGTTGRSAGIRLSLCPVDLHLGTMSSVVSGKDGG